MDMQALSAEFPKKAVHWRVQGSPYSGRNGFAAMALAYIDARDVMDRLDEVCGPENWQDEYEETPSGRVICTLSIRIDGEWVSKSDGAGGTQVEAEKGGISDALKRAAVKWGIGRYLYRLDSPWVACEVKERGGKNYWKRWTEDPWSKVKRVGYQQAEAAKPDQNQHQDVPEFDPAAARDRIKRKLEAARTLADLQDAWKSDADTIAEIREAKPPMFAELNAAKDKRKAELSPPDPAKQAPMEQYG